MNFKNFNALIKKELFSYSIHFYYFIAILFCVIPAAGFFFGAHFFVIEESAPYLSSFFLLFPYVSTVVFPVLCMNIKDRSFDRTLPFTSFELVFSRFLSSLIVLLIFLLPTVLVPVSVNLFTDIDAGSVAVSYLGIIFYGALGLSFCLFMYELIEQRALYFIITVLVLAVFNSIHALSLSFSLNDFFTGLVQALSFSWHFDSAGKGVLDTRDFLYFLLLSSLFLSLTVCVIESKKGKNYFSLKYAKRNFLCAVIFVFAFLNSTKYYARLDFSASKNYSLSPFTESLISDTEEKVRITYYRSKELLKLNPQVKDISDLLYSFASENKNVSFNLVNADLKESIQELTRLQIMPFQLQTVNRNHLEYVQVYSSVVIEYLDRTEIIPVILSSSSLEYDLALRLDFLINGTKRYAYFVSGSSYNNEEDFSTALKWLSLEGIEPVFIDGTKKESVKLLEQLSVKYPLVLCGTKDLTLEASMLIERFVLNGGKAFIMASPYTALLKEDWSVRKNKNDRFLPVLKNWGVHFDDALVCDISNARISFYQADENGGNGNQFGQDDSSYQYVNYSMWVNVLPQAVKDYNIRDGLFCFWASPVELLDDNGRYLFTTSDYSWRIHEDYESEDPEIRFITNPFMVPQAVPETPLAEKKQSPLGVLLDGKITGYYEEGVNDHCSVLVVSDQYFVHDLTLTMAGGESGDFRNLMFLSTGLLNLMGDHELSEMKYKSTAQTGLYKIMDELQFITTQLNVLRINFLLVPLMFVVFAAVMKILRKKRNVL